LQEPHRRTEWIDVFRTQFPSYLEHARAEEADRGNTGPDVDRRIAAALAAFHTYLDEVEAEPDRYGPLDILVLDHKRIQVLHRHGFDDPYLHVKRDENDKALALLPELLAEYDAMTDRDRAEAITRGIFAGNIFDLGVMDTINLFKAGGAGFDTARKQLRPRPWCVDGFDPWLAKFSAAPTWKSAVLFVDNAGTDVVCGMMPLARELLRGGVDVLLTSNTFPALNDITYPELVDLVDRVAEWDETIHDARGDGRLELVPSGNGCPLIDLTRVGGELIEAVQRRQCDLVVLEGMGRAVESNFDAKLNVDTLKIAMLKEKTVAEWLGGEVYDLVLRFDAA